MDAPLPMFEVRGLGRKCVRHAQLRGEEARGMSVHGKGVSRDEYGI